MIYTCRAIAIFCIPTKAHPSLNLQNILRILRCPTSRKLGTSGWHWNRQDVYYSSDLFVASYGMEVSKYEKDTTTELITIGTNLRKYYVKADTESGLQTHIIENSIHSFLQLCFLRYQIHRQHGGLCVIQTGRLIANFPR